MNWKALVNVMGTLLFLLWFALAGTSLLYLAGVVGTAMHDIADWSEPINATLQASGALLIAAAVLWIGLPLAKAPRNLIRDLRRINRTSAGKRS